MKLDTNLRAVCALMFSVICLFVYSHSAQCATSIFITNYSGGTISALPNGGGTPTKFATGLTNPTGIGFNPAGGLYVDSALSGVAIDKVSTAGVATPFVTIQGSDLSGLVTDAAGNVYVSVSNKGIVDKITPSGFVSTYATGVGEPDGLSFDSAGDLYVASPYGGYIYKIAPGGGAATVFTNLTGQIADVAVDSNGNVYASINLFNYVEKYSPLGVDLGTYATIASPYGLAFDLSGNLLVTSSYQGYLGSTVYAIPNGGGSPFVYATGFNAPLYVTKGIYSVPEPDSILAMAICCVGLILRASRRRNGN